MAITPINCFEHTVERARHFLTLYSILHNQRQRKVRSDWSTSFKQLMHWPAGEKISRFDGDGKNSLLILRENLGIDSQKFSHDYCSELLRSGIVFSVSAMDRYFHDVIVLHSWKLLTKPKDEVPKALSKLKLPAIDLVDAIKRQKSDQSARPGNLVRKQIQEALHKDYTFQNISDIDKASKLLGLNNFWTEIAKKTSLARTGGELQEKLRLITKRRNQIVHESDQIRQTKGREIKVREITRSELETAIDVIDQFVHAVDDFVSDSI